MGKKHLSRRTFLQGTAAAGLAGTAAAQTLRKRPKLQVGRMPRAPRYISPNEKLNVAGIGAGGKGTSDINGVNSENIVAICDVDWQRAGRAIEMWPKAKRYGDYRELLEKEHNNIDAVTISTPDHMHAPIAMMAIKMGKHVYVQKPLTQYIFQARALQAAAREYGVTTQMGNQGHCGDGVRQLCEMLWTGAIGKVREAHVWTNRPVWPQGIAWPEPAPPAPEHLDWNLWLGCAPKRPFTPDIHPFKWRGFWEYGCGALGDMGCHNMDPAFWALKLMNRPAATVEVVRMEGATEATYPTKSIIRYEFPAYQDMPPVSLTWYDGGWKPTRPDGLSPDTILGEGDNGSLFAGDDGYATTGTYGGGTRLLPEERMKDYEMPEPFIPRVPDGDPHMDWANACKSSKAATTDFDYAVPLTETALLGTVALQIGEGVKLHWDSANMRFDNNEANALVERQKYREGFELGA